jgi:hypothetical protein
VIRTIRTACRLREWRVSNEVKRGRASESGCHILREEETHLAVGREREPIPDVVGDLNQQTCVSWSTRHHECIKLNHTCRDSGCDGIEDVATEAQSAGTAAPDDGQDLGEFEDGASGDHSESEDFGEGEFEAFGRGQVEVVHEGGVAFLTEWAELRQLDRRRGASQTVAGSPDR